MDDNIVSEIEIKQIKQVQFEDAFEEINKFFFYGGIGDIFKRETTMSKTMKGFQRFLYVMGIVNIVPLMIGEIIFFVLFLTRYPDRLLQISDMMPCLILCFFGIAKSAMLILRKPEVVEVVEDFKRIWPKSKNVNIIKIVNDSLTVIKKFSVFYMNFTLVLGLIYNFLPIGVILYNKVMAYIIGADKSWKDNLSQPYVVWYPYDYGASFTIFFVTYISQFFAGVFITSLVSSVDCFFCLLVSHLCLHFKLLQKQLEDLNKNTLNTTDGDYVGENINLSLKRIVEYHSELYILTSKIESLFTLLLFFNLSISSLLICLDLFSISIASPALAFKYVLFLTSTMTQIMLICFYGNQLIEESESVRDAAYNCNWPDGCFALRSAVLMVQIRSGSPAAISAMGFTTASLSTFSSILSAAWSYFTLLHNVYEGN